MKDDLKEKRIAVVGVSASRGKFGNRIFRDLTAAGYHVDGINPALSEVLGKKIYGSLKDLEYVPDLVLTIVPPHITEQVVEQCHDLGVREIWMQPGSQSDRAVKQAKEYGIVLHHNACIMVEYGIW